MCREIKIKIEGSRYVHVMIRCTHTLHTRCLWVYPCGDMIHACLTYMMVRPIRRIFERGVTKLVMNTYFTLIMVKNYIVTN